MASKMLKSDETLDFHNKQIADVALGQRCKNADKSCAYILTSPLGHVYTNACPNGLHCVKLYGDTSYDDIKWNTKVDFIRASSLMSSNPHAKQLKLWLQKYFKDPASSEDVEITFCGLEDYGEFNSKVWTTIRNNCPPGQLMSYSELAIASGYGFGASKVIGYAINKNPYMLVVGDHRIVKATGEIWCEDNSQRNKLRNLLVNYEISFTDKTLDEALLEVKERNESAKGTRKRRRSTTKVKKEESDDDDVNDNDVDDDDDDDDNVDKKPKRQKTTKKTTKTATRKTTKRKSNK